MHKVKVEDREQVTRTADEDDVWEGKAHEEGVELQVGEPGWYATCGDCSWEGNNPYEDEESARASAHYHEVMADVSDLRATATKEFAAATDENGRAAAALLYNRAGALSTVKEALGV